MNSFLENEPLQIKPSIASPNSTDFGENEKFLNGERIGLTQPKPSSIRKKTILAMLFSFVVAVVIFLIVLSIPNSQQVLDPDIPLDEYIEDDYPADKPGLEQVLSTTKVQDNANIDEYAVNISLSHKQEGDNQLPPDEELIEEPTGADSIPIPVTSSNIAKSIWDLPLSRDMRGKIEAERSQYPQIAFVKGAKTGGTSVAVALNNAATKYGIRLASAPLHVQFARRSMGPCTNGSMHFHQGYKNPWMPRCIRNVRYVTILREPVSQELSWMNFEINMAYFQHYPSRRCGRHQHMPIGAKHQKYDYLMGRLATVTTCQDTDYRKNLTYNIVAERLHNWKTNRTFLQQSSAWQTMKWITSYYAGGMAKGPELINRLKRDYFLVGVTEKLNQFLVLLALANGWEPSSLYYRKCKVSNLDVHPKPFERYFPDLLQILRQDLSPVQEAYQWAKREFEEHTAKLGPWFMEMVEEFEMGLKEYQQKMLGNRTESYHWKEMQFLDGRTAFC
jgi:hypothetical protein